QKTEELTDRVIATRNDLNHALARVNNLGLLLKDTGRLSEAEKSYRAALQVQQELVASAPNRPEYRWGVGLLNNNLGTLLSDPALGPTKPQLDEAEQCFRRAAVEQRRLSDEFPTWPNYRHHLALAENGLGRVLRITGRLAEAEKAYTRARN